MEAETIANRWDLSDLLASPFYEYAIVDRDGCWLFRLEVNNSGYGSIWYKGKKQGIHRASYKHFRGPIPPGMDIHHQCRKRRCFNPVCVEACTRQQNVDYAIDDLLLRPFPCGHERVPDNCTRNGIAPSGKPSYRCSQCNRRSGRDRRGWSTTT